MPELRAFRGLRYDHVSVPDLGAVICPPYDVIGPEQRSRLAARHPRNAVHVELPRAEETSADDPYAVAGELFARWRADGTLRRDERQLVYLYEQLYPVGDGSLRTCRGFFCRLGLEPPGPAAGVRPHERTLAAPREDRYRLLRAVRTNLSPVLLLYEPAAGTADAADSTAATDPPAALLDRLMAGPAEREATADDGVVHRLWIADPAHSGEAAALLRTAASRPLTIADGHHRYQTALAFHDDDGQADDASGSVLALLYEVHSGGLAIAPTHRMLRGVPEAEALFAAAAELFEVELCPTAEALAARLAGGVIGVWTRHGGALLRPRRDRLAPLLPEAASETLRWLDVTVLSSALGRLLGVEPGALVEAGRPAYTNDTDEALAAVAAAEADACFLLAPTPVAAVLEVAAKGEFMPPKSTYFWPKAATGLVFNPLEA